MWHTSQGSKIWAQFSRMSSYVCLKSREEQDLLNRDPVGAGRGGSIYCNLKTSFVFPYVDLAAAVRSDARRIRSSLSVIG